MKTETASNKSTLIRNSFSLLISSGGTAILSFLCFAFLGNKMSVEDYGLFSTTIALTTTVSAFTNNMISGTVVNREIAVDSNVARSTMKKAFLVRVCTFALASVILFFYVSGDERMTDSVFITLIGILAFEAFWDLFEQVSFGLKKTKYTMYLNIGSYLVWLCFVIAIGKSSATASFMLTAYAVIFLGRTVIYGFIDLRNTGLSSEKRDFPIKPLFMMSFPYLYIRTLGTVSMQIPILLLDGFSAVSEVAYYSVGEKFTFPIMKLATTVVNAVFPFLTKALLVNRKKATILISNLMGLMLSFGACGALMLSSSSNLWLVAIMGEKYSSAIEAFNYQIWYTIVLSIDVILSMVLSSDYKQKTLALITTIDLIALLPFMYFGIKNGAQGLAIAKLIAACVCMCYHIGIISIVCKNNLFENRKLIVNVLIFAILLAISRLTIANAFKFPISILCVGICVLINRKNLKGLFALIKGS